MEDWGGKHYSRGDLAQFSKTRIARRVGFLSPDASIFRAGRWSPPLRLVSGYGRDEYRGARTTTHGNRSNDPAQIGVFKDGQISCRLCDTIPVANDFLRARARRAALGRFRRETLRDSSGRNNFRGPERCRGTAPDARTTNPRGGSVAADPGGGGPGNAVGTDRGDLGAT